MTQFQVHGLDPAYEFLLKIGRILFFAEALTKPMHGGSILCHLESAVRAVRL
jgi:hypothetical protein